MFFIKNILVGNTISKKCEDSLSQLGYNIIKLPPYTKLEKHVSTHADMLIHYDGNEIITHREYYNENKKIFDLLNTNIALSDENISDKYPNDILFNAVLTRDGTLFSKSDYSSCLIKQKAKKIINVKQGYTACSVCRVTDNAFITSDEGLYNTFVLYGIDSLLVSKNGIFLPGYSCGFIGGASIVLPEYVCFWGDLKTHTDYKNIVDFVKKHNRKVISLSDETLTDIGGGVVI